MDALVMCGGAGTRLGAEVEKPLYEVGGRPMLGRVLDALGESRIEAVAAAVSPAVPETRAYLADRSATVIETPGGGYVADLDRALDVVALPALTVAADLPLLAGEVIDAVLDRHDGGSLTVCTPAAVKDRLGLSVDRTLTRDGRELVPTGLNVVGTGDGEAVHVSHDVRLAVNVNRAADAAVAEALL